MTFGSSSGYRRPSLRNGLACRRSTSRTSSAAVRASARISSCACTSGWGDPARQSLWTYAFQSDSIDSTKANYGGYLGSTQVVGYYAEWKSYYGCYDMTGNVFEWCSDWYGGTYPSSTSNPTGPTTGIYRVLRGGSWQCVSDWCRVGHRGICKPGDMDVEFGFRSVRTAP